ncbi:MAG: SPOR domain-containing protein [Thermoanaerobaculaceae bacterium]|jgi:hypothetical protein|nr:SPOR domain-containing protein [Thermoanaerobaculaceae bacterium]
MSDRYYEVIITGRQMAALVAGVVILVFTAFGLGVAVRLLEPPAVDSVPLVATALPTAPPPTSPPQAPTPAPAETPVMATPLPVEQPAPTPVLVPPSVVPSPTAAPPPTARVEPTLPAVEPGGGLWVQVAAVSRPDLADGVKQRVVAHGFRPEQVRVTVTPAGLFKVRLGTFPDLESAGRVVARLQEAGFDKPFVVRE